VDPAQFLTAPPVTIVAGKGGVGKTTVTATLALAAAQRGLTALVVEVEGKSGLPALFGRDDLDYQEQVLCSIDTEHGHGEVRARTLTPDEALIEYLRDAGLKRISKRLVESGAVDMVATATPGIKDVLILGKIKQLQRRGTADLIIVDAPAAGHAITFLSSADGLRDAVSVGPIEEQAREVKAMLTDADRCQVILVTLPEETPVNELVETAYSLEDRIGIKLGPVVVNGVLPDRPGVEADVPDAGGSDELQAALAAAAAFRRERHALQERQLERLARDLPLTQLRLPFVFRSDLGLDALTSLGDALLEQIEGLGVGSGT